MRRRPNVILVVLDTQRVDRLSCYGYGRETSPSLDYFAERAVLFEQAISPAQWTIPAHVSMFTGQYPLLHQTVQSDRAIPPILPTITEILRDHGYLTFAFCNNPLVGVLNNGLRRGFDRFFNYASFVPDVVPAPKVAPNPMARGFEALRKGVAHAAHAIERQFGKSERLLALSQESFFVPFWSRLGNFKGDVIRSMRDVERYIRAFSSGPDDPPFFMFINLMETHLPYWPALPFVRKYAQWVSRDQEARRFISRFNTQAYRWATPIVQPLTEMELATIHAMYDAEVAFQDHHLGRLFDTLDDLQAWDHTLVIVVADHGEGFGEHHYMGHAFTLFQEVVHVPLVVHFPGGEFAGRRVVEPVSTRRIFHTILEHAGIPSEDPRGTPEELSLRSPVRGKTPARERVISEAYSPTNFVSVIERRDPQILEPYKCLSLWRALYAGYDKLIAVDDAPDKLYDLRMDPMERRNLIHTSPKAGRLFDELYRFTREQGQFAFEIAPAGVYRAEEEEEIRRRLRGLGYME